MTEKPLKCVECKEEEAIGIGGGVIRQGATVIFIVEPVCEKHAFKVMRSWVEKGYFIEVCKGGYLIMETRPSGNKLEDGIYIDETYRKKLAKEMSK
jgi:hypothetical protein